MLSRARSTLIGLFVWLALAGGSASAASAPSPLARTPYMGWDTYFALPGGFDEGTILSQASALVSSGLEHHGYRLIWLDTGWWRGTRDASGQITVDPKQWPHGIAWLASTLHAAGFQLGLYTDAGSIGCGEPAGSYGHYQQDINTLAAWRVDAIKVDYCGGNALGLDPSTAYRQVHDAIVHDIPSRPILLDICNFIEPWRHGPGAPGFSASAFASYSFGPSDASSSWRTDTDVGSPLSVPFSSVLRNLDADATHPEAAGPGHWNDPDYLGPDRGMSATQFRSQFSMWAMLAAPLMVSDNVRMMSTAAHNTVTNAEMIAIDQDAAGIQGTLLSSSGSGQIWTKPLSDGSWAVALFNRGSTGTVTLRTSAKAIGLPHAGRYRVHNVWLNSDASTRGAIAATVPAGATVVLRVSAP